MAHRCRLQVGLLRLLTLAPTFQPDLWRSDDDECAKANFICPPIFGSFMVNTVVTHHVIVINLATYSFPCLGLGLASIDWGCKKEGCNCSIRLLFFSSSGRFPPFGPTPSPQRELWSPLLESAVQAQAMLVELLYV